MKKNIRYSGKLLLLPITFPLVMVLGLIWWFFDDSESLKQMWKFNIDFLLRKD